MQCMHPIRILDKHFDGVACSDYKSFDHKYKFRNCGYCVACRINRAKDWAIRLMDEKKFWSDGIFLTLTYNDEHLPKNNSLSKEELKKFNKRLRINLNRFYGFTVPIKIFGCGEYGSEDKTARPHYHEIIFGLHDLPEIRRIIDKSWTFGFNYIGDVSHQSCQYVASYTLKKQYGTKGDIYEKKGIEPEFVINSKGIGERFVAKFAEILKRDDFCLFKNSDGKFVRSALPRYYVEKLYKDPALKASYKEKHKEVIKVGRYRLGLETLTDGFELDDEIQSRNNQREINWKTLTKMKGK